jgi:tetratricopeptide (TPR) repeat protein
MRLQLISRFLAVFALTPVLAAGQGRWVAPKCDLKPGHFLVNSGLLYLKNAAETRFDDQREKDLRDAQRTLVQAVSTGGQDKNPAAWYYLARYYVVRSDVLGADSSFRKAETLMPGCHDDIAFWRRNSLWVPSFNAGVTALNAQNYDSAIVLFRQALTVFEGDAQTLTTLATAFFNGAKYDSAAFYFRRTAQVSSDPKDSSLRRDAVFNLGNALFMAQQNDSAAAAYQEYLKLVPNDAQALARLGDALTAAGKKDSAFSVFKTIVAHADSVDPVSVINAGVSIYNAAPGYPDTSAMTASCRNERRGTRTLTAAQRRAITVSCDSVGINAMKARNDAARENYQLAAQAFEAGVRHSPQSRDGLYNLSNTYLALRDPDKMLVMAQRLILVDPMNRASLRLVAQAWQLKGKNDSALYYVTIADSLLPVEVSIGSFTPGDQGASIGGLVTNYHDQGSAALKLVFEFLGAQSNVVATQSVDVPALDGGGTNQFQTRAIGTGIVAWRYHKE